MKQSSGENIFDIVIVGAGMVGGTLACALSKQTELTIALVESGSEPSYFSGNQFDSRVVALTEHSRNILEEAGVWEAITSERVCPYYDMDVWDAEGTGNITFSSRDTHEQNLGHIIENSVIVRALYNKIRQRQNITFFHEVATAQVGLIDKNCDKQNALNTIELSNGETLVTPLLIAADGADSKLRERAAIDIREWDYGHKAIVTTVKTEKSHKFAARQRFTRDGPLAFLPLLEINSAAENYCSIVWSLKPDKADAVMALDDKNFCLILGREFEYRLGHIQAVDKRYIIPLRQRHAKHYIKPGFALVGDAAHTIHPLAGQGVNLGFYDAEALSNEVKRAVRRKLPLSDSSILRRYERVRMPHNLATMGVMEFFKRLYGAESPYLRTIRNEGMRFLNKQTWLKGKLSYLAKDI